MEKELISVIGEENYKCVQNYIAKSIKLGIDEAMSNKIFKLRADRVDSIFAKFIDDTTEEILREIKPQIKDRIKIEIIKSMCSGYETKQKSYYGGIMECSSSKQS